MLALLLEYIFLATFLAYIGFCSRLLTLSMIINLQQVHQLCTRASIVITYFHNIKFEFVKKYSPLPGLEPQTSGLPS